MTRPKQPPPVQFRPGPLLGGWLADRATAWQVNENEAAKRLTCLAACRLDADFHKLLAQLAVAMTAGGSQPDFVLACSQIRTEIESVNRTREGLGSQPLNEAETLTLITRSVREAERRKRMRQSQAEQQQVRVQTRFRRS
jgi:hypothetical protein